MCWFPLVSVVFMCLFSMRIRMTVIACVCECPHVLDSLLERSNAFMNRQLQSCVFEDQKNTRLKSVWLSEVHVGMLAKIVDLSECNLQHCASDRVFDHLRRKNVELMMSPKKPMKSKRVTVSAPWKVRKQWRRSPNQARLFPRLVSRQGNQKKKARPGNCFLD